MGRGVKLDSVEASSLLSYPGLRPAATGRAQMAISADGTVRPSRRAASLRSASRGYLPQEQARLAGVVFQGEDKHAVVEISPVRFDPARSQLVLARRVRVKLSFAGTEPGERGSGSLGRRAPRTAPLFREVLAQLYTSRAGALRGGLRGSVPPAPARVCLSLLRLQRQGEAVAFHVEPAASSVFGPGSVLYFYADTVASSTDFSSEVAYELVRASGGQTMGVVGAAPSGAPRGLLLDGLGVLRDEPHLPGGAPRAPPTSGCGTPCGAGSRQTESFSLSGVDSVSTQPARLVVFLQGASDAEGVVDHHLRFSLNGALVGETRFDGESPLRYETTFPVSLLREGSNDLTIENVGDTGVYSLVFLDKFTVVYPQTPVVRAGLFDGTWSETGSAEVSGLSSPPVVLDLPAADTPAGTSAAAWLTGSRPRASSVRFSAQAGHRYPRRLA